MGSNVSEENTAIFFRVEMKMEAVCSSGKLVTVPILGGDSMGQIWCRN
jgi:hypothetical protein